MSTIPKRSPRSRALKRRSPSGAGEASFEYGYRLVRRKGRGGRAEWTRIPLTLGDVLHPQFGDVHVLSDPHTDDCTYLRVVLKDRYAAVRSVAILSDCGIFWDQPGLGHHSPDLAVIFGVKRRRGWDTFHVGQERARPVLIIEVTSPKTRVNDVETKVKQYAQAGVAYYVIADDWRKRGRRRLELISYRLEGGVYRKQELDADGRAWLEPVQLFLAVTVNAETGKDRVALIDPTIGTEIGDYTAINRARQEAEARAAAEARARQEAEARAAAEAQARTQAEAQVRAEVQARTQAEAQVRAEVQARTQAEAQVQAEVQARTQAEARATAAEARAAAAEERLRRLEAGRRRRGQER
jgi:Uma2 family endonuclease